MEYRNEKSASLIIERLTPYLSDERRARIDEVVAGRTRTVVPVVEGVINTGNVSAVIRSAEALGYQDLHVIESEGRYKRSSRTSQGAEKWLDVHRWPTADACTAHLKQQGYRIVAMHLGPGAAPIDELDFTERTALVFGNEWEGVSEAMLAASDLWCRVPMDGFVQSFNISVAAAVCLYHARADRMVRTGRHGDLDPDEQEALRASFYIRSVRAAHQILRRAAAAS